MINSIIEAISVALNSEFGEDYNIHIEEPEQNFKKPCFFIFCLKPTNELFFGKRYFRTNQFCIQYFPATSAKQRDCNDVAERLYECLEYIVTDGEDKPIRGTKMKYEIANGILHFFVNYDLFVYKVAESVPVMEEVSFETSMKG